MILMYQALPFIRKRHLFSISMPNTLNFAFDYAIFISVSEGGNRARRLGLDDGWFDDVGIGGDDGGIRG